MSDIAPRRLILTLYGLYAREEHNWLSVGSVVRLLGDVGVDSAGVRSSISRLKRRGVLRSIKEGSVAGYGLSDDIVEVLREGDQRIFRPTRATETDGLVVVVYSIPESEREKRHQLRSTLSGMGCGSASPGVWVAPAHLRDEVMRTMERLDMATYVDVFNSQYQGFGDLKDRIGTWWDLAAIDAAYADFIDRFGDAQATWLRSENGPLTAFQTYVTMLTEWRRFPYLDPGLPLDLLPEPWNGTKAAALFHDLDGLLRTPAREHAMSAIHA